MANYASIQAAIEAGISNMTVLRDHVKNDDGTTTYATGIDWFKFNDVVVSNIHSSGNSWIGFGTTTEHLKVNRRDCAVWDEYSESGMIGRCRYYKFTWKGTSYYGDSFDNEASQQFFDVFLFDTGQILLRFFKVPTSNLNGSNMLTCGAINVEFGATAGVPCEYTFTPSDSERGTGWSVGTVRPVTGPYKASGNAVFTLSNFTASGGESLLWVADIPTGTSLQMFTKVDNGEWTRVYSNGGLIVGLPSGACTLRIKAELATTNDQLSPTLRNVSIRNTLDKKRLVLTPAIPNFSSAVGNMTVSYDGLGGLRGFGGPSSAFTGTFTPTGLTWKGHQNDVEHIAVSAEADVILTHVTYNETQMTEHVEIVAAATITLTNIHDL